MPRYPRKYIETSFLHIMTQGINRSYIFDKPDDIKYYIKIIYELQKEYNIKIIAYCIMNNHTHMLVKVENTKHLSNFMLRLNSKYGKYYNKKHDRVGYVFRDRFKSECINNERHLCNCIKYIYDNPVKAGICKEPAEYQWSNYKPVEGYTDERNVFIDVEEDLEKAYNEFIKNFLNKKRMTLEQLKDNKTVLKELITILNKNYNLSLEKISKIINITREKIRRVYNS